MKKIVLAGLTMAFLAGCSSTPLNDAAAPSDAKAGESVDRSSTDGSSTDNLGLDLLRSDSLLTQRSIYFDFDKFEVKPEYLDVVNAHAQYAADHPGVKMTLKGHADYRGSHEYNLALGQKRSV